MNPSDDRRMLLSVWDLQVIFGGIVALDGLSFELSRGEILGLIGPNGAGKTTLFNCLSRLYQPSRGEILLDGIDIVACAPHRIVAAGIGRTFQNVSLFSNLNVRDNILIGAHARTRSDFLSDAFQLPWARAGQRSLDADVDEIISYLDLREVEQRKVSGLPFGTQKRVELGRALAARPKLLLLDEPACGLNHEEVHVLGALIRRIRDERGITVLLVEHHMGLVMSLADRIVALNFGRKLAEGSPQQVRCNPQVVEAYLGASI